MLDLEASAQDAICDTSFHVRCKATLKLWTYYQGASISVRWPNGSSSECAMLNHEGAMHLSGACNEGSVSPQ